MNVLAQLPTMQRSFGAGRISVKNSEGQTKLDRLYQEGAARIRLPKVYIDNPHIEAVLINTAGGMTGGDSYSWTAHAGENTALTLTTQACEKVYRASSDRAEITTQLSAGRDATLNWLPQETILFEQSALSRNLDVRLAQGTTFLASESVILGREMMGETVASTQFHDRWRVWLDNQLVHAEDTKLDGDLKAFHHSPALLKDARAFASLLLIAAQAEQKLEPLRKLFQTQKILASGASFVKIDETGKLCARLVARDGAELRRTLIPALELLNNEAGMPKVWRL